MVVLHEIMARVYARWTLSLVQRPINSRDHPKYVFASFLICGESRCYDPKKLLNRDNNKLVTLCKQKQFGLNDFMVQVGSV